MSDLERIRRLERELTVRLNLDLSRYGEAATVDERVERIERALAHTLALAVR